MKTLCYFLALSIFASVMNCSPKKEAPSEATSQPAEQKTEGPIVIQAQAERDTLKGSLKAVATGKIGGTVVTINYHSPAVRGRVIWGGLVPMDQVWVTGAHKATAVEFEGSVKIGDVELSAGKYGLFTIPGKDEWTIIINKNWDQHLTDEYDQKEDVVRITVKPEAKELNQERLRYVIESEETETGRVVVYWEMVKVSLPVTSLN